MCVSRLCLLIDFGTLDCFGACSAWIFFRNSLVNYSHLCDILITGTLYKNVSGLHSATDGGGCSVCFLPQFYSQTYAKGFSISFSFQPLILFSGFRLRKRDYLLI